LERRFQPIMVEEPSEEDAVEILFGLRAKYEEHHGCAYSDDALRAAVHISARYIQNRFLPDKARGLLLVDCSQCTSVPPLHRRPLPARQGKGAARQQRLEHRSEHDSPVPSGVMLIMTRRLGLWWPTDIDAIV